MCKKIDEKNQDVQEKEVRRMEVWEYLEWKMGEKNEKDRYINVKVERLLL